MSQSQIHIVAAEKQVLPDRNSFQRELSGLPCHCDQAEISSAPADIAHQKQIACADLLSPFGALIFQPGVKCGLRLLEQGDLTEASEACGFQGETSGDFIERGRDGHHDLVCSNRSSCCAGAFF